MSTVITSSSIKVASVAPTIVVASVTGDALVNAAVALTVGLVAAGVALMIALMQRRDSKRANAALADEWKKRSDKLQEKIELLHQKREEDLEAEIRELKADRQ